MATLLETLCIIRLVYVYVVPHGYIIGDVVYHTSCLCMSGSAWLHYWRRCASYVLFMYEWFRMATLLETLCIIRLVYV